MSNGTLSFMMFNVLQKEEKERRVPKFEVIQGGLGSGGNEPPVNWLIDFPVSTQFMCESKNQRDNFMVLTLEVWRKTERTVRLWDVVGDKLFSDVNPHRFVNSFALLETLYDPRVDAPKQEETNETITDG